MGLIYLSGVLTFYPYINKRKSFKPFCEKLDKILAAREEPLYAFQPDERARAIVPFYTGHYMIPVSGLDNIESIGGNKSALLFVMDRQDNMPNYKSVREMFPNVLLSGLANKRYMKLLSNEDK